MTYTPATTSAPTARSHQGVFGTTVTVTVDPLPAIRAGSRTEAMYVPAFWYTCVNAPSLRVCGAASPKSSMYSGKAPPPSTDTANMAGSPATTFGDVSRRVRAADGGVGAFGGATCRGNTSKDVRLLSKVGGGVAESCDRGLASAWTT